MAGGLLAGLMHAALNATSRTWGFDPGRVDEVRAVVFAAIAVAVVVVVSWLRLRPRIAPSTPERFVQEAGKTIG
jgi:hypothetical protein